MRSRVHLFVVADLQLLIQTILHSSMSMALQSVLEGRRIGFLGAGMMATAMIRGLIANGVDPSQLAACDVTKAAIDNLPTGVKGQ